MSEMNPLAVLIAFILNALSCAVAVDNAQLHPAYLEAGHRGAPGRAEVDLFTATGSGQATRVVAPARVAAYAAAETQPSRAAVLNQLKQLPTVPARPPDAAMPVTAGCRPAAWRERPSRWPSEALPFEHRDNEEPCQQDQEAVGAVPADQEVAPQNQTQLAGHREYVSVHSG
jgi:hypothetical protein